jgi:hypothetical protein
LSWHKKKQKSQVAYMLLPALSGRGNF